MTIIDAHHHLWNFDPERDAWIDDTMVTIQRDFTPDDLRPELKAHGIAGTVVVQADQSELENMFLLSHAQHTDFIKGVVGWVDLRDDDLTDRLDYFTHHPKMKGFRHVLQGEPQRDLMLTPTFLRGISKLGQYGYTYDILIYPDQLGYISKFVAAFPDQLFVIDHLAKPDIKGQHIDDWRKHMEELGQHENVYMKVSGMVTEARWNAWIEADFDPYLDVILEAFGTKRLMYGSDWPVCLVAGTYNEVFTIASNYFKPFSTTEQAAIFGGNAIKFYNLNL